MLENEAENLLENEGFNVVDRALIKSKKQLRSIDISYPLAIKIISKKAVHKAKIGGVILNIKNLNECEKAFENMRKIDGFEGVLIQKMIRGKFVILGLKKTPEFGLVIMFGKGGGEVEEKRDVSFRVCPIKSKDADEMIKEVKMYKELKNNEKRIIKKNILKVSKLSEKYPEIEELDINPLIVNKDNAVIVDARIALYESFK